MINNIFNKNNLIFIGCLVYGFFNAFFLRQECFWDFTNYHYYNAFAFLNDRLNYDIVLGSINSFFNPLLDLPLYWMIQNINDFPRLIFGIQGLYFGICLFFFIKICSLFWNIDRREGICATAVAVVIAITGEAVGIQIGTSTNEIQVTAIFMPALYFLFKILIKPKLQKSWKFLAVGVGMGIALGLKQTVIIYCLSSGLTTIILYKRLKHPFKYICLFALGGALGYLVSNGWLMWRYWQDYQNPFFPFANAIFKSEWFDPINYRDTKFLPTLQNFWYFPLTYNKIRGVGFKHCHGDMPIAGIDFVERGNFRKKRDAVMQAYKGPTILIYHPYRASMSRPRMEILEELQKSVEKEIKEKNLYCRPIKQNFYNDAIICVEPDLKTQILGN